MKFWDREKEIRDLKRYLQSEPNAILFVYGPKSSGKSTLVERVTRELGESYKIYWYDLRGKVIDSYKDVLGLFFREVGWKEKMLSTLARLSKVNLSVFELDTEELGKVLSGQYDAFEVMERELAKDVERGQRGVIVFDEIQNLKEVFMNGGRSLVSRLFNFFVRITKVLHLSHVLVMTSDTFFIEEVYTSSALKNTSEYYLVDYFDDETAFKILVDEGLSEDDARYAVENIGGVPWMMERILSNGDVKEKVEELYMQHRARLRDFLLEYEEWRKAEEILRSLLEGSFILRRDNIRTVKDLVQNEILFYDPINGIVKFQNRLDERAARDLMEGNSD